MTIYVETLIRSDLEKVWRYTQTPELHSRWDLRFTDIHYLPRPDPPIPQRFRYQTRIGFGCVAVAKASRLRPMKMHQECAPRRSASGQMIPNLSFGPAPGTGSM